MIHYWYEYRCDENGCDATTKMKARVLPWGAEVTLPTLPIGWQMVIDTNSSDRELVYCPDHRINVASK